MTAGNSGIFVYDISAQALFDAAGITSDTVKTAVNNCIITLKSIGFWTKCNAIYGFAGDDISQTYASQYKYNWKDPQDTDAAFRLTFTGGWTFASTGILPSGSDYADTHLNPNSVLSKNDTHYSFYSRTNSSGGICDIGCEDPSNLHRVFIKNGASLLYYVFTDNFSIKANANSLGLHLMTRTSSTAIDVFKNGSSLGSDSIASTSLINFNMYIGATNNNGSPDFNSTRECAFATIGSGIDSSLAASAYTAIQTYQTALSRNV